VCRSIKTLFNFEPPATDDEVRAAALQFLRKLSGMNAPSHQNERAFERAVDKTYRIARELVDSLVTQSPPRNRELEAARAKLRAAARFGERA